MSLHVRAEMMLAATVVRKRGGGGRKQERGTEGKGRKGSDDKSPADCERKPAKIEHHKSKVKTDREEKKGGSDGGTQKQKFAGFGKRSEGWMRGSTSCSDSSGGIERDRPPLLPRGQAKGREGKGREGKQASAVGADPTELPDNDD